LSQGAEFEKETDADTKLYERVRVFWVMTRRREADAAPSNYERKFADVDALGVAMLPCSSWRDE
jgi:predicted acyl esterase